MRLGFWPAVYGNWIMTDDPSVSDPSFATALRATQVAEAIGFDTLLLAEHFIHPNGPQLDLLDAWTTAAALAVLTKRIEILVAVKPGLRAPGVVAKQGANIDRISGGRFAVNLVSAWWPPEYEMLGAEALSHDARYARAEDYINIVKGLWTQDHFTYRGPHYQVTDATIAPKPLRLPHPPVYLGGESDVGKELAARVADIYLINGRPPDEIAAMIADMDRRATNYGRKLRYGISGMVICRETEAAAEAEQARLAALRHMELKGRDTEVTMHKVAPKSANRVGTNGGTDTGLVGTARQIADRMFEFEALGVETFLLQFEPTVSELERFGREVMPLLRPTSGRA